MSMTPDSCSYLLQKVTSNIMGCPGQSTRQPGAETIHGLTQPSYAGLPHPSMGFMPPWLAQGQGFAQPMDMTRPSPQLVQMYSHPQPTTLHPHPTVTTDSPPTHHQLMNTISQPHPTQSIPPSRSVGCPTSNPRGSPAASSVGPLKGRRSARTPVSRLSYSAADGHDAIMDDGELSAEEEQPIKKKKTKQPATPRNCETETKHHDGRKKCPDLHRDSMYNMQRNLMTKFGIWYDNLEITDHLHVHCKACLKTVKMYSAYHTGAIIKHAKRHHPNLLQAAGLNPEEFKDYKTPAKQSNLSSMASMASQGLSPTPSVQYPANMPPIKTNKRRRSGGVQLDSPMSGGYHTSALHGATSEPPQPPPQSPALSQTAQSQRFPFGHGTTHVLTHAHSLPFQTSPFGQLYAGSVPMPGMMTTRMQYEAGCSTPQSAASLQAAPMNMNLAASQMQYEIGTPQSSAARQSAPTLVPQQSVHTPVSRVMNTNLAANQVQYEIGTQQLGATQQRAPTLTPQQSVPNPAPHVMNMNLAPEAGEGNFAYNNGQLNTYMVENFEQQMNFPEDVPLITKPSSHRLSGGGYCIKAAANELANQLLGPETDDSLQKARLQTAYDVDNISESSGKSAHTPFGSPPQVQQGMLDAQSQPVMSAGGITDIGDLIDSWVTEGGDESAL